MRSRSLSELAQGNWRVRVKTISTMTCDADTFYVENCVTAYEGTEQVFDKTWSFQTSRELV